MKQKVENKFSNILNSFLLLHPIIDLITSLCIKSFSLTFTLGSIIRILFLAFTIYVAIFIYKEKKILWYYALILVYMFLFMISVFVFKDGNNLIGEIEGFIKSFYFPILLTTLYAIRNTVNWNKKCLMISLIMYIAFIFIPTFFKLGFDSYEITKEGTIGFFYSANEISAIISILTPFLILYLIEDKIKIHKIVICIIYIISILSLGTKTPLLALIITIILLVIWYLIKNKIFKDLKKVYILILTVVATITLGWIIIPKTSFYKNIETHLEFLEVDNITEVFKNTQLIDHFVFSQRLTFLDNKRIIYDSLELPQQLIGMGYYENSKELKMIEIDYFDIYYNHGPIGFTIYFSIFIFILIDIIKKYFGKTRDLSSYMIIISVILILSLSFFTGHVITAPSVSYISLYIIMFVEQTLSHEKKMQTKK